MKTLIITAHPSSKSFTHAIQEAYVEFCKKNNKDYEHINLYDPAWKMDFLAYEEKSEMKNLSPMQLTLQSKIQEAHELVFILPIWWINIPAILKNFFDSILTSGFAYKYTKNTIIFPDKLLKGKTAKIFCTCDAWGLLYWLIGNPLRLILQVGTLGWCGIKTKKYVVYDRMRKRSSEYLEKKLTRIRSKGY